MPTVECSKKDLEKLIGKKFTEKQLDDALLYAKAELDKVDGDTLKVDVKDTNRPDLWSAEGLARELRARLGLEKGLPKFKVKKSKVKLYIDKSVKKSRPYIVAALAKNVKVTEDFLIQMVQLQEKLGMTHGRKRSLVGLGLYDFDKMKAPVYFKGIKPRDIKFAPLDFDQELYLDEIIEQHPKGKQYAHLMKDLERYPIVIDAAGTVCAMPPIINSNTTGRVTEETKNLFIECTGFDKELAHIELQVMVAALHDRGAEIESIEVIDGKKKYWTPNFTPKKAKVNIDFVNKLAGMNWSAKEIVKLLERARYNCKVKGKNIELHVPSYREDLLHEADIVEDAIISHGYNNFDPEPLNMSVTGQDRPETRLKEAVRNVCVGLQLQEVLTYNLSSKQKQMDRVGLVKEQFVEISNPMSSEYAIFRKQLFPELLTFLGKNAQHVYPQHIFEIGKGLSLDKEQERGVKETDLVGIVLCGRDASFNKGKKYLQALCDSFRWKYNLKKIDHAGFKSGLCAEIQLGKRKGIIGEVKPSIMKNFSLDMPAVVVELEITE